MSREHDLYKEAGVDIEKGDAAVAWLKSKLARQPLRDKHLVSGFGGFADLYLPDFAGMKEPCLVASTDGVGTKIELARQYGRLKGLGTDLVTMCVNDLYCTGARPLFFLDYYATGQLNENQFRDILQGILDGLDSCGAVLLGGETAEHPGTMPADEFDLAGFVVGVVDRQKALSKSNVKQGDQLIAVESSGFHANGFSLVRKWLVDFPELARDNKLIENLLVPTKIYAGFPALFDRHGGAIRSCSHITGGGISGNIVRILPPELGVTIEKSALPTPEWMSAFINAAGADFHRTESIFNWGAGMILITAPDQADAVQADLAGEGLRSGRVGEVVVGDANQRVKFV